MMLDITLHVQCFFYIYIIVIYRCHWTASLLASKATVTQKKKTLVRTFRTLNSELSTCLLLQIFRSCVQTMQRHIRNRKWGENTNVINLLVVAFFFLCFSWESGGSRCQGGPPCQDNGRGNTNLAFWYTTTTSEVTSCFGVIEVIYALIYAQ